ncbi:putative molybdopterin binding domain-containing protein [Dipodascopsis tothii]|uniref:putative molybdopterin binding domain-containing protein n=1 Tax=Dipodascopsis tothii TaxID=44089 RepID=UPI0034CDFF51
MPTSLHSAFMASKSFVRLVHTASATAHRMSGSHTIRTGACLIIGDEVLNGKIKDTNSYNFARFCFANSIDLKRIEVVGDVESEIVEAAARMARDYDFVVTSGGIGPTHDDITYQSLAKAFGLPLELHAETAERMGRLARTKIDRKANPDAWAAQMRMATLPSSPDPAQMSVLYPMPQSWVPVVVLASKVHVLPGVPSLFTGLLDGVLPTLLPRIVRRDMLRLLVKTAKPESVMAPFLTELQARADPLGIKIGSYPHMLARVNTVSIVGESQHEAAMRQMVADTEAALEGNEITLAEEETLH